MEVAVANGTDDDLVNPLRVIGLLAACGTGTQGQPAELAPVGASPLALEAIPAAPTQGLAKGMTLPLDGYSSTPSEKYAWQVATQNRWRACMARYGFKNFSPLAPSRQVAIGAADSAMGRRYGVSDLETVKKRGYHLPETTEPPRWEPRKGAEEAVFTGVGVRRCSSADAVVKPSECSRCHRPLRSQTPRVVPSRRRRQTLR